MILITGGLGYLGGRISQHLHDQGEQIRIGSSRENPSIPTSLQKCEVVHIDLLDQQSLDMACSGVSTIVHLAAMNAPMSGADPEQALMINGMGTLKLLTAAIAHGVENFLYFSTFHVYGSALHNIVNENSLPRPIHPYSITHRLAEDYVLEANAMNKISGTVLRLSNVMGSPLTKDANCWMLVVNDICRQVVMEKKMKFNSPKHIERDFLSIIDICNAVSALTTDRAIMQKVKGEIINISKGSSVSLEQMAKLIAQCAKTVLGYTPEAEFRESKNAVINDEFVISNQKAKDIGLHLETDLSGEIERLLLNCQKWFGPNMDNS